MVYIHIVFFIFIFCRNLSKTRDALDPISLNNTDLLNKWICEESNLLDEEDISWKTIKALLCTLTLEDEEICLVRRISLIDDCPYIPPQDQDPYFYD